MKVSDRLTLIDKISRELQSRFGYVDIDIFLGAYQIPQPKNVTVNSKRIYSAIALKDIEAEKLVTIAEELGINHPGSGSALVSGPKKGHLPFIILAPSPGNETIGSYASMKYYLSPSSKAVCLHLAFTGNVASAIRSRYHPSSGQSETQNPAITHSSCCVIFPAFIPR